MDLLAQHHRAGRRFRPADFVERGTRVAVKLAGGGWKVFTYAEPGGEAVLLQDCVDRDDAFAYLDAE